MTSMVMPGPGNRLLVGPERIVDSDQWTVLGLIGWGMVHRTDVGCTVIEARTNSTYGKKLYYRREVSNLQLCGCGQHDIDGDDDVYVQHNAWAEGEPGE